MCVCLFVRSFHIIKRWIVVLFPMKDAKDVKKEEEKEGNNKEEKKEEEKKNEEPPEIVLKVDMHCKACARKVARALKGFEGFC